MLSPTSEQARSPVPNPWLVTFQPRPRARARLFCFHHAGGGAAMFRLWSGALPETIEVCAVQLPGRSNRLREPVVPSIPSLVGALAPVVGDRSDLPFAFFGHSMGAVLAAEVTRALMAAGGPLPEHLVISSRRPVHLASEETELHGLGDDAFVRETMRRYGGIPREVLADRDVLGLLLPSLRADMTALETYRPDRGEPLPCPITVFGGEDDPIVPAEHLAAWKDETRREFALRLFPGDHFYLTTAAADVLAALSATLQPLTAVGGVSRGAS